jgi:hypothetical protein
VVSEDQEGGVPNVRLPPTPAVLQVRGASRIERGLDRSLLPLAR